MGVQNRFHYYSDKLKPQFGFRWITTFVLMCFRAIRVYLYGYYFVTFMLGMLLTVAVAIFLTSCVDGSDPDPDLLIPSDGLPLLPIKASDKLRPFVPILPEFRLWCIVNIILCVALGMTFIPRLNIPGPWYIYIGVWLFMVANFSVDHISLMTKYKYFPFYYGDKNNGEYKGK